jgi:polyisoprenoid-binding protein YceI
MKKFILLGAAVLSLSAFDTINPTWKADPPHSQLGFTVTHFGINDISGTFNDFQTTVSSKKPDFSDARFELTAKTASVDTRVEARNNHLKSADFFDVEKYPALTYTSTSIKKTGRNHYKLTGNLSLHGITKPVTTDLVYKGTTINPMSKKQTVAFQITGAIRRSAFGIGEKFPEAVISDEVRIKADGEFAQ